MLPGGHGFIHEICELGGNISSSFSPVCLKAFPSIRNGGHKLEQNLPSIEITGEISLQLLQIPRRVLYGYHRCEMTSYGADAASKHVYYSITRSSNVWTAVLIECVSSVFYFTLFKRYSEKRLHRPRQPARRVPGTFRSGLRFCSGC